MIRTVFSIIAGLAAGIIIITLVDKLGDFFYPAPSDLDYSNKETVMRLVLDAPFGAVLFIAIAWALGSFSGGMVSSIISNNYKMLVAIITGLILMAAGLTTLLSFSHPVWIWIVGLSVYIPFAYLGAKLGINLSSGKNWINAEFPNRD